MAWECGLKTLSALGWTHGAGSRPSTIGGAHGATHQIRARLRERALRATTLDDSPSPDARTGVRSTCSLGPDNGWVDWRAGIAAAASRSSTVVPATGSISVTLGFPSVSVPVGAGGRSHLRVGHRGYGPFRRPEVCRCTTSHRPFRFSRIAVPRPSDSPWPRGVSAASSYRKEAHATFPRTWGSTS